MILKCANGTSILWRLNCQCVIEEWLDQKWRQPSICRNEQYNLTVGWYPHCQPFTVGGGKFDDKSYTLHCASRRLQEISNNENIIFVFSVYFHISMFHHDVFRKKVILVKNSLTQLLKRNPNVQFFIKGPQLYRELDKFRWNDFYAYVHTNIFFDVFKALLDRVVFLNNIDPTAAVRMNLHPPEYFVSAMVDQFLSYIHWESVCCFCEHFSNHKVKLTILREKTYNDIERSLLQKVKDLYYMAYSQE